jgi:hypothetical protein
MNAENVSSTKINQIENAQDVAKRRITTTAVLLPAASTSIVKYIVIDIYCEISSEKDCKKINDRRHI